MIFDQYQRYRTVQIIVEHIKKIYKLDKLRILELGANEECNLEKVLPNEEIVYSDIKLSQSMQENEKFIEADGTDLSQFEDEIYDIVIALDVLEHVPKQGRENFLLEAYRVSKYIAILCFPYDSYYNSSAEKCANSYYKSVYGIDHIWLKEHLENGLPKLMDIENILKKNKVKYSMINHGDIAIWGELIKALFASYRNDKYNSLMNSLDEFYEKQIYKHDMSQKSYRVFVIMGKNEVVLNQINAYLSTIFDNDIEEEDLKHLYTNISDLKRLAEREEYEKKQDNLNVKIYYNYGNGYNENDTKLIKANIITENKYRMTFIENDVENICSIRIDPIENKNCIISKCAITQGEELLHLEYSKYIPCEDGVILLGNDPMIMPSIKNNTESICVDLEVITEGKEFTEELLYAYQCQIQNNKVSEKQKEIYSNDIEVKQAQFENEIKRSEKQKEQLINEINENKKQKEQLINEIKEKDTLCKDMECILKMRERELNEMIVSLQHEKEKIEELKIEVNSIKQQYNIKDQRIKKMESTISWRVTKGIRKMGKIIKR